jgi:hypothetical protein
VKKLTTIVAALAVTAALSGCGVNEYKEDRGRGDAPVSTENNDDPANIVSMPNNFANVAYKCVGPDMVYVTSRPSDSAGHGIFVVPNHPDCAA